MSSPAEAFYAERDQRTIQVGGHDAALSRPVHLVVGPDAAASRPGQAAVLATVNMLARVHRQLHLVIPAAPILARGLIRAADLPSSAVDTAAAINPFMAVTVSGTMASAPGAEAVTAAIGTDVPGGLDLYIGWIRGRAEIATHPVPVTEGGDALAGAGTASCLLAAGIFRASHGSPVRSARINLVERTEGDQAGTGSVAGPIDVGDVLVVGAGAVAHGLLYWAREFGTSGRWTVVDGDVCKLHNTNRCLGMTACHAGWPDGLPGGLEELKAAVAAAMVDAQLFPHWYDEWAEQERSRPDVVLPLANERAVRTLIAGRGEPILLHATTSPNWSAQLHRHIPGRDDCPACRFPDDKQPTFTCATGPSQPEKPASSDAALPFVSSLAGLQLAAALLQLPGDSALLDELHNQWQLDLALPAEAWLPSRHPRTRCEHVIGSATRARIYEMQPRRWDRKW
jgi:molybdopterin/thiamine biosynthesis adenylyltransferase